MASKEPIFRSIEVGEGQSLSLDAPIPADVLPLMHPAGPNRMMMNPGTFHRAETITVELAGDRNVQRMDFTYDAGTRYHHLLEEYRHQLGRPTQDNADAPDAERRTLWEDSATRFELFASGHGGGSRVGSTLENAAPAA
jgi:hypothetical protein